jgi:hypothetical protein
MQETSVTTLSLQSMFIAAAEPAPIARGTRVPVRADIRNTGAVPVIITTSTQDVRSAAALAGALSQSYRLPPGETVVMVLKDKQAIYAGASGAGGEITVSVNEALPLV